MRHLTWARRAVCPPGEPRSASCGLCVHAPVCVCSCCPQHGDPSVCMPLRALPRMCVWGGRGWGVGGVPVLECMRRDPSGPVSGYHCECVLSHLQGSVCVACVCLCVFVCLCHVCVSVRLGLPFQPGLFLPQEKLPCVSPILARPGPRPEQPLGTGPCSPGCAQAQAPRPHPWRPACPKGPFLGLHKAEPQLMPTSTETSFLGLPTPWPCPKTCHPSEGPGWAPHSPPSPLVFTGSPLPA